MTTGKEVSDIHNDANPIRWLRIGVVVLLLVFAILGFEVSRASAATMCPPGGQGFWKNHTKVWFSKITGLTLGTTLYTDAQLLTLLKTPVGGDASVNLAHQLIAALLSIQINNTSSSPISATIADANTLLGAGPIPEHVAPPSTLGHKMIADADILGDFNEGEVTTACGNPVPVGSCQPSSSLSVLVSGTNVTSYVPKGAYSTSATGVSVINVEGSSVTPTLIPTADVVNSCASNSVTGKTVCTANGTDVYLLSGTTLGTSLTSGGSGSIGFSGGSCTNCGVAMDAVHNRVAIGLSIASTPGFQFLNLATSTFETPVASPSGNIAEDPLIDPIHNLLLSPSEPNNYEIANLATSSPSLTAPTSFFENSVTVPSPGEFDSAAEDCDTEIALAPAEFTTPSSVYIADLKQATFTAGAPGTWSAASQVQTLSESVLPAAGPSGIAVAQGTHTGIVSDEFGSDQETAIALPATSGSGTPAIGDWVTCGIGGGFSNGLDPHTVTAYKSPASGDAIALLANDGATTVAVVDLTKMLNTTTVPRTVGGHACASGTLPAAVVSFIAVP
jgi:hypothetical protein